MGRSLPVVTTACAGQIECKRLVSTDAIDWSVAMQMGGQVHAIAHEYLRMVVREIFYTAKVSTLVSSVSSINATTCSFGCGERSGYSSARYSITVSSSQGPSEVT